jgi:pilus assembly protein Flp/PilA
MSHLKLHYSYLFSLALRTNPFGPFATPENHVTGKDGARPQPHTGYATSRKKLSDLVNLPISRIFLSTWANSTERIRRQVSGLKPRGQDSVIAEERTIFLGFPHRSESPQTVSMVLQPINRRERAMQKYLNRTMEFLRDEEGASAAEYALLIGLIAGVIILGVGALGTALSDYYNNLAAGIPGGS